MAEDFLRRWSRLKHRRAAEKPVEKAEREDKPIETKALPPVENLTPESDFTDYMQPKVEDALRRAALKKLFVDPHFNIPDPFEPFSGDWRIAEEISPAMLASLNQAKTLLFDKQHQPKEEPAEEQADAEEKKPDEPGRQDA